VFAYRRADAVNNNNFFHRVEPPKLIVNGEWSIIKY